MWAKLDGPVQRIIYEVDPRPERLVIAFATWFLSRSLSRCCDTDDEKLVWPSKCIGDVRLARAPG